MERAEELEAATLRTELLQQHAERHTLKVPEAQPPAQDTEEITEVPGEDLSVEGPYDEVPLEAEAEHPRPAKQGWNESNIDDDVGASLLSHDGQGGEGGGFCSAHSVGYFCSQTTRVRCCKQGIYYRKCGSQVHSSACGWHGSVSAYSAWHPGFGYHPIHHPIYHGGGHPGWHPWYPPTSFCTSHHVGTFCSHHTRVSCCRSGRFYRTCSTSSSSRVYC